MGKTKNRREELKRAWQSFKQRGSADGEVRQEVFESWERCRQLNQTDFHNDKKRWPPADDEKVQKILNQNEILISTASLLLSRIAEMVSDSQYVISLHDRHCYMTGILQEIHWYFHRAVSRLGKNGMRRISARTLLISA